MKMLRIFRLVLALCLLVGILAVPALAAETTEPTEPPVTSGTCGENVTWEFLDGVLTIGGTGEMKDYSLLFGAPWTHLRDSITAVVIGDGVTYIGEYAFSFCEQMQQLHIGSDVTSIGKDAASFCDALQSLTIPSNVRQIGTGAFEHCKTLKTLTIEYGVSYIGSSAFVGCLALEEVAIPDSVTVLGAYAFSRCEMLRTVKLSSRLTVLATQTFRECTALERIEIPDGVTELQTGVFQYCQSLSYVRLGSKLTVIAEDAFYDCRSLSVITLPEGVKSIGGWAFYNCAALETMTIPKSVETIGNYAFISCNNLKKLTIKEGVTAIGASAFKNCTALVNVTIPDSVTDLGDHAFYSCTALTTAYLSENMTQIGSSTFYGCENLERIVIPDTVTAVGDTAFFRCRRLSSVSFGKNLQSIGYQAFTHAGSDLEFPFWISFAGDAPVIDARAFIGVTGIARYYGLNPTWTEDVMQDYGGKITWEPGYSLSYVTQLTMDELMESYIHITPMDSKTGASSGKMLRDVMISSVEGEKELLLYRKISINSAGVQGVVLTKEGYQDYVIPAAAAQGMWGSGGKAYDLTAFMTQLPVFGKNNPYISTIFGRNHGTGESYVELRSTRLTVSPSVTQDVVIAVRGFEGHDVSYYLGTRGSYGSGGPRYLFNKTGVFSGESLYSLMNDSGIVYVWARSNITGKEISPIAIHLSKAATNTDMEATMKSGEISLLGEDGVKVKLGGNSDLFGGMAFDVADFETPVGVYVSGNTMKVSLGIDIFENGETKDKANSKWEAFKKLVWKKGERRAKASKALSAYEQWRKEMESFGKNHSLNYVPWHTIESSDFDFKVGAMGFLEYKYVNSQWVLTEGCLGMDGEFSLSHDVQAFVGWVPVYGSLEGGAEIQVAGDAKRGVPDKTAPFRFDILMELTPKISVHAGVGVKDAASGGLYGAGYLPINLELSDRHLTIKAKGEIGAEAEFFGTTSKKVLLSSDEIMLLDKYFGVDVRAAALRGVSGQVVTAVMDRDYAGETSEWLGTTAQNISALSVNSVAALGVSFRDLQTGIFSNSQPQLAAVGDQMVLVWSEDDSRRDSFNRMRMVYSVYDPAGDTWSDPAPVWDDGHNDGYARMVSDGENVWLLWQKVDTALTRDTAVDLAYVQANTELCLARFDPASGTFRDQQMITDNDIYEYANCIYLRGGAPVVLWASAADNALNAAGVHSITGWTGNGSGILAESVNFVRSIAAADGEVTYVADADGDLTTTADITAFTITENGTSVYDNSGSARAVTFAAYASLDGVRTLFVGDQTNVRYLQDGQWKQVFADSRSVGAQLQIVETPLGVTLLWTESEQGWNELYTTRFSGGSWSEPVRISDNGQVLSRISAVCYDGRLAGVCNANSVSYNSATGEYEQDTADLRFFQVNEFTDLVLDFTLPMDEAALERGTDTAVDVAVYNRGTTGVDSITFTVSDTLGTEQTQTLPVQLASGESRIVTLTYPVPEAYGATVLTISASTAAEDADPSDNAVSMEIGRCDLAITDASVELLEDGYLIKAVVENASLVDATIVTLEVTTGGGDSAASWIEYIGTIGRGDYALAGIVIPAETLVFDENNMASVYLTLDAGGAESAQSDNTVCVLVEKVLRELEEPEDTVTELASGWSGYTQWTLTSDGVLTVRGEGNMKNYGYGGGQPWLDYADRITSVVIENGVTAVGSGAFMGLTGLESVALPDSGLTKIGEAAFYGCAALKEVYIPEGIYTVWSYTFKGCTALESVRLPKTLIKIDQGAFENCTGLPYVFIPTNTQIIGSWSFKGCTGLTEADMQWADATEIREGAFKNCTALSTIILPVNIQKLGDSCFYGIGADAFTVPETVTAVEAWCFARAGLTRITFVGDAPTIGEGAFNKITLTACYPAGNATWTSDLMQNYGGSVTWKAN